jgi:ABC-type phosphate/phosphonate transport system permease subunit
MMEKSFSILDIVNLAISIVGMVFLFRGNGNFTSDLTESFDNRWAYVYGILTILCWSLANLILHKNKIYIHHTIDTLFVALFNTILIPAFILCYFSEYPVVLYYEWE